MTNCWQRKVKWFIFAPGRTNRLDMHSIWAVWNLFSHTFILLTQLLLEIFPVFRHRVLCLSDNVLNMFFLLFELFIFIAFELATVDNIWTCQHLGTMHPAKFQWQVIRQLGLLCILLEIKHKVFRFYRQTIIYFLTLWLHRISLALKKAFYLFLHHLLYMIVMFIRTKSTVAFHLRNGRIHLSKPGFNRREQCLFSWGGIDVLVSAYIFDFNL